MKTHRSRKSAKPLELKSGNVRVKIYQGRNHVGGTRYDQFTLVYREGNQRIRKRFATLDAAKHEANFVLVKLENRHNEVLKLEPTDRAIYVQALDLLKPFTTGDNKPLPLNLAVAEYAEARRHLPPHVGLKDVVADYLARRRQVRENKTVAELVAEYIAAKEQADAGDRHLRDLRSRLGRFGEAFTMPVTHLTGPMIQAYIDALPVANRSKLNNLRHIGSVLRWAVRRKYASRDMLDELAAIERPVAKPSPTLVFTPAELREIFAAVQHHRPDLIPAVAILAFCGLRSAEVLRLDWRDVKFDRAVVEVVAEKAKTATRRVAPLPEAARAWLAPYARAEGEVCPVKGENRLYDAVLSSVNLERERRKKPPFKWKRNGLRHAFCSYRLTATHDLNRVALEAGNSPAMLHAHYKELVSQQDAEAWFNTLPDGGDKLIPLPVAARA